MSTLDAITSFAPGSGHRVPPRSHLRSSAEAISLAGTWAFHYSRDARGAGENAAAVDFDDSQWDRIAVPGHWVLQGGGEYGAFGRYGAPAYQNVDFPFPVDVPFVPDDNPTGDYRTSFTLSDAHLAEAGNGGRIVLRTLGIESLGVISVNGEHAGDVRGSRLTQELDITGLVHAGENVLHVRVHQWSSNSYLEDQDQWWLPGIFRDIEVLIRPAAGIEDVWIRADFTPSSGPCLPGPGTLIPEIRAHEDAFPVTVRVAALGIEETFETPAGVGPIPVPEVEPWSADSPTLYEVEVSNAAETITLKTGFRRVEIRGHLWMVNGKKLRIRGVNRHEYDPVQGRVWDPNKAREGLLLMKRHNINAIRTSHYPPHPELFDLADELGFWVMDECDYEAHGFEASGWVDVPANDPRWRDAMLDRVQRYFERDKNHPSIISWSLGNEGHTGTNMAAMAEWLHARDPERPVHYEPDFDGMYTDMVSRMYPPIEQVREMAEGRGQGLATSPGRNAELAKRPMILCEYVHAMGNGPGGLSEYEDLFSTLPQWHGGFIWEWRDHGILARTADGTEFYGYGGDFGEQQHDGSFVCDGLVLASGAPTPGLVEAGAVFSPVLVSIHCEGGFSEELAEGQVHADGTHHLWVRDSRHGGQLSDFRFVLVDEVDGREVARHEIDLEELEDSEFADRFADASLPAFVVPDGGRGEAFRTVRVELVADTPWAKAGHEVTFTQVEVVSREDRAAHALPVPPVHSATVVGSPASSGEEWAADARLSLGEAEFDTRTGDLVRLRGLDLAGPRLTLFRAPTENDSLSGFGSYLLADPAETNGVGVTGPSAADLWRGNRLHLLQRRVVSVSVGDGRIEALHRYSSGNSRNAVDVHVTWWLADSGALQLRAHATPTRGWGIPWARLGLEFVAPAGASEAAWFGTGPGENYPDSCKAARVGRFEMPASELVTEYAVPQESGYRPAMRELNVRGFAAGTLHVETDPAGPHGERPGFQLRGHSVEQVAAARHPHELGDSAATHLIFDLAQHGLGTRSCGPDVRPEYQLRPRSGTWSMRFEVR